MAMGPWLRLLSCGVTDLPSMVPCIIIYYFYRVAVTDLPSMVPCIIIYYFLSCGGHRPAEHGAVHARIVSEDLPELRVVLHIGL